MYMSICTPVADHLMCPIPANEWLSDPQTRVKESEGRHPYACPPTYSRTQLTVLPPAPNAERVVLGRHEYKQVIWREMEHVYGAIRDQFTGNPDHDFCGKLIQELPSSCPKAMIKCQLASLYSRADLTAIS